MSTYVIIKVDPRGIKYGALGLVRSLKEDAKKALNEVLTKVHGVAFVPYKEIYGCKTNQINRPND